EQWNYPLPGDTLITTIQRVVIDLTGPKVVRLQMPADQHRSTICDHVLCGGRWADVEWSPDGSRLVFVSTSRDHKKEQLRSADADHDVTLSPDGRWFVDSYSRPDVPPVTLLRDAAGRTLLTLERADISRLQAAGWKPPIPITVKARDGKTDLYGLLYRPTHFDSTMKYPIVNHDYPGPQTGSVGGCSFSAARGDAQALAELGFIVVEIDAMGTPLRSKSFHDAY